MTNGKNTAMELAARIVAGYVSRNIVPPGDLPALTSMIHATLSRLIEDGAPPVKAEPAVPVGRSVKRDQIVCLECGRGFRTLKRHLSIEHDLTPEAYRARYELRADYPLVAPAYAAMRSETAKRIGLGRKPGGKPGRRRAAK